MRPLLVAALVATVALAGCFEPYRAHVPNSTLEASGLDWNVTKGAIHGSTFGAKTTETRYVHTPSDAPPYPGVMQVFSIRGGAQSMDDLLRVAEEIVDEAIEREGIVIDEDQDAEGTRKLLQGATTHWFTHAGFIPAAASDSILFAGGEDMAVRILGETGYDGKAKTAFIVVAFVQVGTRTESGLPGGLGGTEEHDERTWFEVVGDAQGSVQGATVTGDRGLVWHLRSHD